VEVVEEDDEGAEEGVEDVLEEGAFGSESRLSGSIALAVVSMWFEFAVSRTLSCLLSSPSGLVG
jgi:hypothetical protein